MSRKWRQLPIDDLRNFFEALLGRPVAVLPSARMAIQKILEWRGVNRAHTVFAPKWTSHCVWSHITPIANPSTSFSIDNDVTLCVHHWGYIHSVPADFRGMIIEDSVDSLLIGGNSLFPNGGDVEILSIPKIIGTRGGGLIIFRTDSLRDDWLAFERQAMCSEQILVESSMDVQEAYLLNQTTIERRLSLAKEALNGLTFPRRSACRLSPVLPVACDAPDNVPADFVTRHFNVSQSVDKPDYRLMLLVPLHFGVDEDTFNRCLDFAASQRRSLILNLVKRIDT